MKRSKQKGKESYYAFLDAEYTCYMDSDKKFDRSHGNEVLSVGIVISNQKFQKKKTFYSAVRPIYNPKLTGYCKELTGLTQEEIDAAPSYEEVFGQISLLLQEYPVKEIFVWGSDHSTLMDDLVRNHKFVHKKYQKMIHQVTDITKKLTHRAFGRRISMSLSNMKYICDMERVTAHNALEDAEDLYAITKCIVSGKQNKEKTEKMYTYIHNRDLYHQYRRFRKEQKEMPGERNQKREFQQFSLGYISLLEEYHKEEGEELAPQLKALCDDLRILSGLKPEGCPKLEE